MQSNISTAPVSKTALWAGRILSGIVALFLFLASVMDLAKSASAVEGMVHYGYPESSLAGIGVALLVSVVLYLVPRTSVLGAILLTGYLGGAVATHVRAGDPLFRMLVPVLFGLLAWGGLYLRDDRLRALVPFCRPRSSTVIP
ncbi:MAG: DoxX family protein [Acidobacteriota bacterium]|nr:DoxX family protein [Acidobacteriota bacterium]